MTRALGGLLADADAIVEAAGRRLSERAGSVFRLKGAEVTGRALRHLVVALREDVAAGSARQARGALREALAALAASPISARDLRLLQEGLRGEVMARVEAAELLARDARPIEDWFYELTQQGALHLLAQREELIERQAAEIEVKVAEQRQLSIPIVQVYEGVLVVPLVGALDLYRAQVLVSKALAAITQTRARLLLLDVSGIPRLDAEVVGHVLRTVRAARLLGSEAVLVGVSPEGARAVVDLGVESGDLIALRSLEEGLAYGVARRRAPARRR
ncbi:MAG TPA: STAS domain-containing protein [Polyangiaceae bacterium]|nr:STAS domain-containing protein [Polyangiaceae bacterium]